MNRSFNVVATKKIKPNRKAPKDNPLVILFLMLFSLFTLNAFADTANSCGGGGAAIFNVFDGGKVGITNQTGYINETDTCKVNFGGSNNVNVGTNDYYSPTGNGNASAVCDITPTNQTLGKLTLPAFPADSRSEDISFLNSGSQIKVGANTYNKADNLYRWCLQGDNTCANGGFLYSTGALTGVKSDDGATFPTAAGDPLVVSNLIQHIYGTISSIGTPTYFKYNGSEPYVINKIEATNQSVLTFEPGTYYIKTFNFNDNGIINVAGTGDGTGKVKLYIENDPASTFTGNQSCINIVGATTKDQCATYRTNLGSGSFTTQDASKLQLYFYNGNVTFGDSASVSAAIYVDKGDLAFTGNSSTSFNGEALAQNIHTGNMPSYMNYQDTGVFKQLYDAQGTIFTFSGEYSKAPAAIPKISQTGDLAFIPSQIEPNGTNRNYGGYLKAFALNADGTTGTTPIWTIGDYSLFSTDPFLVTFDRFMHLFSNQNNLQPVRLPSLVMSIPPDVSALDLSLTQTPDLMKFIMISLLGPNMASRLSPSISLMTSMMSAGSSSSFASMPVDAANALVKFLNGGWDTVIGLPNETKPLIYKDMVLFATSDGYLYAADRQTGALQWGWMPRPLLPGLKEYEKFLHSDPMKGQLSATVSSGKLEDNTADNTTNSKTGLVFGTAKGGAIHYGLNIGSDGSLGNVAWIDQRNASNTTASGYSDLTGTSPNAAAPTVFANGAKVLYVVNNVLVIRPSAGGNPSYNAQPNLGGNTISTTPFISSAGDLYVGDNKGFIWVASGIESGNPSFSKLSTNSINGTTTGSASDAVRYLGIVPMPDSTYLFAQSDTRLTVFKKKSGSTSWKKAWTSTVGSSTLWDDNGTVVAAASSTDKTKYIQTLPAGAKITAATNVTGGVIFLPVSTEDPVTCAPQGSLYAFNIENGFFPPNSLYGAYYFGNQLNDNITLGTGIALAPQSTVLNGGLYVEGQSQQNAPDANGNVADGLDNPVNLKGGSALMGTGDWRELIGQ